MSPQRRQDLRVAGVLLTLSAAGIVMWASAVVALVAWLWRAVS